MRKQLGIAAVVVFGLSACGGGGGVPATATKGDAFCKLAQVAADDSDAVDALEFTDSAKVKLGITAAIDSLSKAAAKAPKDIAATVNELLTKEEQVETLLKANGYDFLKMAQTDEGKKLVDELSNSTVPDEFDKYLTDKCGIVRANSGSDSTVPSDTTPFDTSVGDTSVSGDTSVDTIVDFGEGEAAINKFLDFYEIGTGVKLTSDERSCIVSQLVDKVTGSDLNQAVAGQASDKVSQALGLAFLNCKVAVQS